MPGGPELSLVCTAGARATPQKSLHATERETEWVRVMQRQHLEHIAGRADVLRLYLFDETGLRLDCCRCYGPALHSQRETGAVPLKRGQTLILIGALGLRGLTAQHTICRSLK